MKNGFIDIKKIVGNKYNAGIYAYSNKHAVQLLDINNRVVSNLKIMDKIDIFKIVLNKIINNSLSPEFLGIERIFDVRMDAKEQGLEEAVNDLFHKVMFLYSKPNVNIKEILSISDLVSNRLSSDNYKHNDYVKEELSKKVYYI